MATDADDDEWTFKPLRNVERLDALGASYSRFHRQEMEALRMGSDDFLARLHGRCEARRREIVRLLGYQGMTVDQVVALGFSRTAVLLENARLQKQREYVENALARLTEEEKAAKKIRSMKQAQTRYRRKKREKQKQKRRMARKAASCINRAGSEEAILAKRNEGKEEGP